MAPVARCPLCLGSVIEGTINRRTIKRSMCVRDRRVQVGWLCLRLSRPLVDVSAVSWKWIVWKVREISLRSLSLGFWLSRPLVEPVTMVSSVGYGEGRIASVGVKSRSFSVSSPFVECVNAVSIHAIHRSADDGPDAIKSGRLSVCGSLMVVSREGWSIGVSRIEWSSVAGVRNHAGLRLSLLDFGSANGSRQEHKRLKVSSDKL